MIEQRKQQRAYEKRCLGCYTAHFLRKHFSDVPVAVDGGSTNLEVIKAIHQDSKAGRSTASFVLTNNLEGLYLAARDRPAIRAEKPNWRSTGGVLRDGYMTLIAGAEASITNLSFSVAVIGANGFWPPYLMTNTPTEQALKSAMIQACVDTIIVPLDASKWGSPGEKFVSIKEIVATMRKRLLLLTCYPTEAHDSDHMPVFLESVRELGTFFPSDMRVFTVLVEPETADVADETDLEPRADAIAPNICAEYARNFAPQGLPGSGEPRDRSKKMGMVIGFDFRLRRV